MGEAVKQTKVLAGFVCMADIKEHDTLCVADQNHHYNVQSIADFAELFSGKLTTVRYWASNAPINNYIEAQNLALQSLYNGKTSAKFWAHYSELTGHLWTDELFNVGGHDMIKELKSFVGNFIYLIVEV
jgi:hypothetical protein